MQIDTRNVLDCDQCNYSSRIIFSCTFALEPPSPKTPPYDQTGSRSDDPFQRYGRSKFFKMAASRHLGFGATGNSAIRSADLENPTLEPNVKWIG